MIDSTDIQILSILQGGERVSNAEIARRVDMTPSGVLERIRRLRKRGVVQGFYAAVNPESVGLGLLAFIFVKTREPAGSARVGEKLAEFEEVLEVHHVAGEDCYLVKVRTRDAGSLGRLLRKRFATVPEVVATRTTVVLETHKESLRLPLAPVAEEGAE